MQVSLETLYDEIKTVRQEVEIIRNALIPEEEITEEERAEIRNIRQEMDRGEKTRFDDMLADLNV